MFVVCQNAIALVMLLALNRLNRTPDGMGWAEGFEPSATGTTIRRSTKLSYAHREGTSHSIKGLREGANIRAGRHRLQ